uniref:Uncharacterized protein n=1 Tax=Moniliophthora roreri TaxID=221103 RepID=A0A0W0GF81_MONRR
MHFSASTLLVILTATFVVAANLPTHRPGVVKCDYFHPMCPNELECCGPPDRGLGVLLPPSALMSISQEKQA